MKRFLSELEKRLPVHAFLRKHLFEYQVPQSLNIWYVFGLIAVILVVNQFLSGIYLAMFYMPSINQAFASIQTIMHDVPSGWFIRYLHTTGASLLFVVLYLHMFRGLLYGSYRKPRELVWGVGVVLFILMLLQSFLGYVLPWGQMSYWGAEVATSAIGGLPWIGPALIGWVRGSLEVGAPLLQRFYALHVIAVPLLILYIIKLHIVAIRYVGSSTPTEEKYPVKIAFFPNHVAKESFSIAVFVTIFFAIVFFAPEMGGVFIEPINAIAADPMQTPTVIHPPWYITPYFAMLRCIPNLFIGVITVILSLLLWFCLPLLDKGQQRVLSLKPKVFQFMVYLFAFNYILLGFLGWFEHSDWSLWCSRCSTLFYFLFFVGMPWYSSRGDGS